MTAQYPSFKATLGGATILAVPFLWFFDWQTWAWICAGIFYTLIIAGWLSQALEVYRANKATPQSPFKSDFVTGRRNAESCSVDDDEDDYGETIWTGSKRIRFAYRNAMSDGSDREVTVHKVEAGSGHDDDIYFQGYCHLRNEPRTFRLDRVKGRKVVDTGTGEIGTLRQVLGIKRRLSR
ncbi:hypothetical protein DN826_06405 [Stutzerimonas nosocomialis]|uniref:WYL domain-containing protein n=1 Tax=Stutzerimonas nosocomialis TaxID=1056496 RepID=UPI001107C933|nr:WYL domain-containing protein [Stutzerimonas nosocomialis]TLX57862.1 hypothetical protein DN826_06405 [Stutzerimonas nosocomialis]